MAWNLDGPAQTPVHPLRRLAERLARPITITRRLPADFGRRRIVLSPANRLRALDPSPERFEPTLFSYARRFVKPGMAVWDIGANMGCFALPAAHRACAPEASGQVLAIEPDPFNQMLLHRSRALNPDMDLTVVPAALSAAVGLAELQIAERGRAANSLADAAHGSQMGGLRDRYRVVTLTLDWLCDHFTAPDLIKCDAEGAEVWILQGGQRLLSSKRPAIIMEVPRENAAACTALFHGHDYTLFAAEEPIDPAREIHAIGDAWEIIAVPRERLSQYEAR